MAYRSHGGPTPHLCVTGLPSDATEIDVDNLFSRQPGDLLGYADFTSVELASDARQQVDGYTLAGTSIKVAVAFAPAPKSRGGPEDAGPSSAPPPRAGEFQPPAQSAPPSAAPGYSGRGRGAEPYERFGGRQADAPPAPRHPPRDVRDDGRGRFDGEPRGGPRDRPRAGRYDEPPPHPPRGGGRWEPRDLPPRDVPPRRDTRPPPPPRFSPTNPAPMTPARPIPGPDGLGRPSHVLHVSNAPNDCTERELTHIFAGCAGFKRVDVRNKRGEQTLPPWERTSRPVVFVHFASVEDATAAIGARQGYVVDAKAKADTALGLVFSSKFAKPEGKEQPKAAVESATQSAEPAEQGATVEGGEDESGDVAIAAEGADGGPEEGAGEAGAAADVVAGDAAPASSQGTQAEEEQGAEEDEVDYS